MEKILHLRGPTAVMVLPNRKHISSAIWKFMTCFPAKLVTFPVCPGYWHDFGARQNLPSECLCLGQMVTCVSCVADIPRIPTLAMISSASVTSPHFGNWQLNKWAEMSALHSDRKTWLSLSLEDPQGVWSISWSEQLLCLADILWRIHRFQKKLEVACKRGLIALELSK